MDLAFLAGFICTTKQNERGKRENTAGEGQTTLKPAMTRRGSCKNTQRSPYGQPPVDTFVKQIMRLQAKRNEKREQGRNQSSGAPELFAGGHFARLLHLVQQLVAHGVLQVLRMVQEAPAGGGRWLTARHDGNRWWGKLCGFGVTSAFQVCLKVVLVIDSEGERMERG